MKDIMMLRVVYNGRYGGHVDEHTFVPEDYLKAYWLDYEGPGHYERLISLGELEGKHSDCYGDLIITSLEDLDLSVVQLKSLVGEQDNSEFYAFFEDIEQDIYIDEDFGMSDEEETSIRNRENLIQEYSLEEIDAFDTIGDHLVKKAISYLLSDSPELETIMVEKKQYYDILELLQANNYKTYN